MHCKQIRHHVVFNINAIQKHQEDLMDYFYYYFSKRTRLDNMISTKNSKDLATSYYEMNHKDENFFGYRLMKEFKEFTLQHKYIKKLEDFKRSIDFESFDEEFKKEVLDFCKNYCAFSIQNQSPNHNDFIIRYYICCY